MASTRDVTAPPVFASGANTVIPPTPIAGISYRDPSGAPGRSAAGWPFQQIVNSADFNQIMFQLSSLLSIIDRKGLLGWSPDVDYTESSILFGSDGQLYIWAQASGPSQGGARDPLSSPAFWSSLSNQFGGQAGDVKYVAAQTPPAGWLVADGSAISRSIYSNLFSRIGTTFGSGDGSTTFNIPDLRAEFIRGWDAGRGVDSGRVFGSYQKGSLVSFDPTVASPVQSGLHTTGSDSTIRSDLGIDPVVPSEYPQADVATGSSALVFPVSSAAGVSRPRSLALLGCIKF